ncbi:MAG TPA: A24 family peptidase [Thermomicrobiaceae bacterium]|nr:A24 family peptidase [Thermomicrobiaceae bacterium]
MLTDPGSIITAVLLGGLGGAAAGSIIYSATSRLPAELGPLGRPVCAACGGLLPGDHLIPAARRACPACGARPPLRKSAIEAAAVGIAVLALLLRGLTYLGVTSALFSLVLLLILVVDWRHHLIYTATIVPGLALAIVGAALHSTGALLSALLAAAGAGLVFGLLFALALVIYRQEALGFGDILLAALIGAMTGIGRVVPAIFIGMVLAAAGGLLLIVLGRRGRRDYIPYGAYLCAGTILVLLLW